MEKFIILNLMEVYTMYSIHCQGVTPTPWTSVPYCCVSSGSLQSAPHYPQLLRLPVLLVFLWLPGAPRVNPGLERWQCFRFELGGWGWYWWLECCANRNKHFLNIWVLCWAVYLCHRVGVEMFRVESDITWNRLIINVQRGLRCNGYIKQCDYPWYILCSICISVSLFYNIS